MRRNEVEMNVSKSILWLSAGFVAGALLILWIERMHERESNDPGELSEQINHRLQLLESRARELPELSRN